MNEMHTAYKLAAAAVRQRFAEQNPALLEALQQTSTQDVAVYRGDYDHVEQVLGLLAVPKTMQPNVKDLRSRVIFVNCAQRYDRSLLEQIAGYVHDGAWLVTSDWALGNLLEHAFPGTVRRAPRATGDEVVAVEPGAKSLWSDVVVLGADPQWWLESSSHTIEVVDAQRVRVEAASHELLQKYNAPVVAVRFPWGRGMVFHIISHFWHKRSRTPSGQYQAPGLEFLRTGMRLSEDGIREVVAKSKVQPEALSFAAVQSAVTATELVAQLCARAVRRECLDEAWGVAA